MKGRTMTTSTRTLTAAAATVALLAASAAPSLAASGAPGKLPPRTHARDHHQAGPGAPGRQLPPKRAAR
jgi:hypothetical protein